MLSCEAKQEFIIVASYVISCYITSLMQFVRRNTELRILTVLST